MPNRANSPTTTNGFDIHSINHIGSQFDIIYGQGFGNHIFQVNQCWNPWALMPYPNWIEPNFNGNIAINNYHNMNLVSFNIYHYNVPEVVGYVWEQPTEGYGYTHGVQANSGSSQSLLTQFMEEGSCSISPDQSQSQSQNQQHD